MAVSMASLASLAGSFFVRACALINAARFSSSGKSASNDAAVERTITSGCESCSRNIRDEFSTLSFAAVRKTSGSACAGNLFRYDGSSNFKITARARGAPVSANPCANAATRRQSFSDPGGKSSSHTAKNSFSPKRAIATSTSASPIHRTRRRNGNARSSLLAPRAVFAQRHQRIDRAPIIQRSQSAHGVYLNPIVLIAEQFDQRLDRSRVLTRAERPRGVSPRVGVAVIKRFDQSWNRAINRLSQSRQRIGRLRA